MIASLAFARGIASRAEVEDNDNDNNNNEEEEEEETETKDELAPDSVIPSPPSNTQDCAPAANVQTDRISANTDQTRLPNMRSMLDRVMYNNSELHEIFHKIWKLFFILFVENPKSKAQN